MADQSPAIPPPAALARVRRPAPSQPSRGRRPAEIEKERERMAHRHAASRELHLVLFAAGDDDEWSDVRQTAMATVTRLPTSLWRWSTWRSSASARHRCA